MTELEPGDPRWTLKMELNRRGLITRNQVRKLDRDEQKRIMDTREVRFPWGAGIARGYKL